MAISIFHALCLYCGTQVLKGEHNILGMRADSLEGVIYLGNIVAPQPWPYCDASASDVVSVSVFGEIFLKSVPR